MEHPRWWLEPAVPVRSATPHRPDACQPGAVQEIGRAEPNLCPERGVAERHHPCLADLPRDEEGHDGRGFPEVIEVRHNNGAPRLVHPLPDGFHPPTPSLQSKAAYWCKQ